jgi:hypothetical protein
MLGKERLRRFVVGDLAWSPPEADVETAMRDVPAFLNQTGGINDFRRILHHLEFNGHDGGAARYAVWRLYENGLLEQAFRQGMRDRELQFRATAEMERWWRAVGDSPVGDVSGGDVSGGDVSGSGAEARPVEQPSSVKGGKRGKVNLLMLETLQADESAAAWTSTRWVRHLGRSKAAILATPTWRMLRECRERMRAERAVGRRGGQHRAE